MMSTWNSQRLETSACFQNQLCTVEREEVLLFRNALPAEAHKLYVFCQIWLFCLNKTYRTSDTFLLTLEHNIKKIQKVLI